MASAYTTVINISLPKAFLPVLEEAAKAAYASRSDYIRQAVLQKIAADQAKPLDDWFLVENLPDDVDDESLLRLVKQVKARKGHSS